MNRSRSWESEEKMGGLFADMESGDIPAKQEKTRKKRQEILFQRQEPEKTKK